MPRFGNYRVAESEKGRNPFLKLIMNDKSDKCKGYETCNYGIWKDTGEYQIEKIGRSQNHVAERKVKRKCQNNNCDKEETKWKKISMEVTIRKERRFASRTSESKVQKINETWNAFESETQAKKALRKHLEE